MAFVFSYLHMKNLLNDIVSTVKQLVDVVLSFITGNAETQVFELNSNMKNKSQWTLCHLIQIA